MSRVTGLVSDRRFLVQGEQRGNVVDPWSARRLQAVLETLDACGTPLVPVKARELDLDDLVAVHTAEYVQRIRDYSSGAHIRGDDFRHVNADTAIASNTYELAVLAAGTVCGAIDAVVAGSVRNALVVARPGDHHAYPARGGGFCIFNHTAIGARYAQRKCGIRNVMILDWDVHHGNGTQAIFYSDPSVLTFSIHSYGAIYPRTGNATERGAGNGRGTTINVPVEARTQDKLYLAAFSKALRRTTFVPDLVLIVAGFDSHVDDPVGNLNLTAEVYPELTRQVMAFADEHCAGRLVSVLAGGYNLETIGDLVAGHVAALHDAVDDTPPPISLR